MKQYVSIILAAATFFAAVVSPIVVAIINNRHQRKMYLLQHRETKRQEVLENYLRMLGSFVKCAKGIPDDDYDEFFRMSGMMYLFVDEQHWDYLDAVSDYVLTEHDIGLLRAGYRDFCKAIAEQLKT